MAIFFLRTFFEIMFFNDGKFSDTIYFNVVYFISFNEFLFSSYMLFSMRSLKHQRFIIEINFCSTFTCWISPETQKSWWTGLLTIQLSSTRWPKIEMTSSFFTESLPHGHWQTSSHCWSQLKTNLMFCRNSCASSWPSTLPKIGPSSTQLTLNLQMSVAWLGKISLQGHWRCQWEQTSMSTRLYMSVMRLHSGIQKAQTCAREPAALSTTTSIIQGHFLNLERDQKHNKYI